MSEEIEVIDLGAASEKTNGAASMILMELGTPPFNWLFLSPGDL